MSPPDGEIRRGAPVRCRYSRSFRGARLDMLAESYTVFQTLGGVTILRFPCIRFCVACGIAMQTLCLRACTGADG